MPLSPYCGLLLRGLILTASALLLSSLVALAVPIQHDPNGFEGIPWGTALSESETFDKTATLQQSFETRGPAVNFRLTSGTRFRIMRGYHDKRR